MKRCDFTTLLGGAAARGATAAAADASGRVRPRHIAHTNRPTIDLQPGNEDVALETLIEPELLFAAGQVR